jgi:hypothetical protein
MNGNAKREGALTHCRSGTNNVECSWLQSEQHFVQVDITSWYTSHDIVVVGAVFELIEGLLNQNVESL